MSFQRLTLWGRIHLSNQRLSVRVCFVGSQAAESWLWLTHAAAAMCIVLHSPRFHKLPAQKARMRASIRPKSQKRDDGSGGWLRGRGWRGFLLSASHKARLCGKLNKTLLLDTLITRSDIIHFFVFVYLLSDSKRNTLYLNFPGQTGEDFPTLR